MTTITALESARAAAYAAWNAAPERTRAEKASKSELEAALAAANRELVAAKRAAAPAAPAADVDAAMAAQAARQARDDLRARVKRAMWLYVQAQEYPRCGQGWPRAGAEAAADALLRQHSNIAEEVMS